ncbi:hypothetical protein [Pedobacter agri]|uniref:hypothetical protein n=1 Tax=Pedobacter agri TaxID=454586 RepID=UPI0029316CE8|nr:hypothetical protein [Pedobacter agri]
MKNAILIRNVFAGLLLFGGLYLSLSAIIALPLLEEDAGDKQENYFTLKDNIETRRDQTVKRIESFDLDSLTILKYNAVSERLDDKKRADFAVSRLKPSKQVLIDKITDGAAKCIAIYDNANLRGKIQKKHYAARILQDYMNFCMLSKQRVTDAYQEIIIQTASLYATNLKDTSRNYNFSRLEKERMDTVFAGFKPPKVALSIPLKDTSTRFFIPAGWAIRERSQDLIIIIGLLGFALFGSVVGATSKPSFNDITRIEDRGDGFYNMVVVLVRGFSAAIVVYLSIKGGLSLITTSNSDKINPYVILFVCFISAVFSDNIWEWAKTKLVVGAGSADELVAAAQKEKAQGGLFEHDRIGVEHANQTEEGLRHETEVPASVRMAPGNIAGKISDPASLTVPYMVIQEAIALKKAEWIAAFGVIDVKASKLNTENAPETNVIEFIVDNGQLMDLSAFGELPNVISYRDLNGNDHQIPIVLSG